MDSDCWTAPIKDILHLQPTYMPPPSQKPSPVKAAASGFKTPNTIKHTPASTTVSQSHGGTSWVRASAIWPTLRSCTHPWWLQTGRLTCMPHIVRWQTHWRTSGASTSQARW
ncbi:hypothetical protein MHYP_G00355970 [Metynnis hypsauchen]